MQRVMRVAWYRFRATFAQRWGGLLALTALIGLLGGLAIGAAAGARRTQSSFPAFLARIHSTDLEIATAFYDPQEGSNTAYDPGLVAKIARLPLVEAVGDDTGFDPNVAPIRPLDLHMAPGQTPPVLSGSIDGEGSALDRVTLTNGRLANPERADEMVMSASAARELGLHIGSVLPLCFYTNQQKPAPPTCDPNATGKAKPHLQVNLKLVGIVVFGSQVVEDDIDALADNQVLVTSALMRQLVNCCAFYTGTSIKVEGGSRNVRKVQAELAGIPQLQGLIGSEAVMSTFVTTAERAIEPESIALGVFGAIAGLAALLIASQIIGRQIRLDSEERAVLRALGANPASTVIDGLFGVVAAIAVGALSASAIAIALSPLAPLGPVRRVEHPSIALDWTAIGLGFSVLLVVLGLVAVAVAVGQAPHRVSYRRRARTRGSRTANAVANTGAAVPVVTGIRFALDPGAGRTSVPVRSAIIGTILAVVVLTSTVTFGASLRKLVSHPSLYGWNWNYQLLAGFSGQEDLPQPQVTALLDHDPYVAAWTGVYFGEATIDGMPVPVIAGSTDAPVAPPLLSGHGVDAPNQVVLAAITLAALHKHLGDSVAVDAGQKHATALRIVGTATMPTIGDGGSLHTTMGTGALLATQLIPAAARNQQGSPIPGPNAILIRIRNSANPTAALHSLQHINNTLNTARGGGGDQAGGVTGVLRPAEIVNYRSMGSTPALLGTTLAVGAVAALALTLIASVRRRRRELALLKALGFTRRQLAAVAAWQSSIAVAIGVVIGVPLGIIIGRSLWKEFANAIHVVPAPTVPAAAIALIAIGALVVANIVAAIPGLLAARTRTALLLHAE